jgi:hypothetical protein
MAQTNFTPISLYYSTTAAAVPTAGNLVAGELAINTQDGKLFYKDAAGVVQTIASKAGALGDVVGPASATDNAISRFDATTGKLIQNSLVTVSDTGAISAPVDASISGLTVGKGGGAIVTNTAVGGSALSANTTGQYNTGIGYVTANSITTGQFNTAVGMVALRYNQTGNNNTAMGYAALNGVSSNSHSSNSAFGYSTLVGNTTGGSNTAIGSEALQANTTASQNTAVGYQSLYSNTTATENVAVGFESLRQNTTGASNTAVGHQANYSNTTGGLNIAMGRAALYSNTTGANNTALGYFALLSNTTANDNTAVGYQAGYSNTTGTANTFLGMQSGYSITTASNNVFVGIGAGYLTTGGQNTFVGRKAGAGAGELVTTGTKNTILGGYDGNQGGLDIRTLSNRIVISDGDGNIRIYFDNNGYVKCQGVYDQAAAGSANVVTGSNGDLYRSTSALKYKQDIRDLETIDINKFRPVRYKSKCAIDDPTKDHFGIIADEVHDAGITELVTYGADGEVEGFQYERLTVVLLKELQTLKAEFEAYKATHP